MRLVVLALFVVSFVVPNNAYASSVEELFHQFSLFGIWANDCSAPATPGNPYVSITAPSAGLVREDHNLGSDYAVNRYSVLSAEKVSATGLSVKVIFQPGTEGEERQNLVFSVRDNTRRTIFNRTDGGTVRVKNGIALARGSKTPLLHRCDQAHVSH
jgi:hypothetical protein